MSCVLLVLLFRVSSSSSFYSLFFVLVASDLVLDLVRFISTSTSTHHKCPSATSSCDSFCGANGVVDGGDGGEGDGGEGDGSEGEGEVAEDDEQSGTRRSNRSRRTKRSRRGEENYYVILCRYMHRLFRSVIASKENAVPDGRDG